MMMMRLERSRMEDGRRMLGDVLATQQQGEGRPNLFNLRAQSAYLNLFAWPCQGVGGLRIWGE